MKNISAYVGVYSTLANAKDAVSRQKYYVEVILGDDGNFWVATGNNMVRKLVAAGYEKA